MEHSLLELGSVLGHKYRWNQYEEVPDWRKADLEALRSNLDIDWDDCLQNLELDAENTWTVIKNKIKEAELKSVPLKRRAANKPLWMQQYVLRTIRKKKRLWETYQRSRDYEEYLALLKRKWEHWLDRQNESLKENWLKMRKRSQNSLS